jgi:NADH:ubiquinone oxidoreductase subunit 4 (subunit M)
MDTDPTQLYKEAAFVGIALVPMWYLVAQFTTATMVYAASPQMKTMVDVALAGALFHLAAEESGLNHYYLTNSHAYQQSFSREYKDERRGTGDIGHDVGFGAGAVFGF